MFWVKYVKCHLVSSLCLCENAANERKRVYFLFAGFLMQRYSKYLRRQNINNSKKVVFAIYSLQIKEINIIFAHDNIIRCTHL